MDKKEQLLELLKEANKDMVEKIQEGSEATKEAIEALKAESTEMKEKIEAIENSPAKKAKVLVPGSETKTVDVMYKKRFVPGQGAVLKLFHTPEKQEVLAKSYIDFVQDVVEKGQGSLRKAMVEGTPASGGYMVFDEYVNELMGFARLSSWALNECRIMDIASKTVHLPKEGDAVSVAWKAETIAAAESNPTVGEVQFAPDRLTAYSTVSNELLEDSAFDIVSWLTSLFAEAIGQKIDTGVISGAATAGSDPFTGLANQSDIVDSTGTLNITHLTDVITKLPVNKMAGAKFLFHRLIYKQLLDIQGGDSANVYLPNGMLPKEFYGYPVILAETAPSTLANGNAVGYFGNFKNYIIARRMAAGSLDVDIYGKFLEYMTRFRTVSRWDGRMWNGTGMVRIVY